MTQGEIICKVVDMFDKNNIQYMLIGGIAVNYYRNFSTYNFGKIRKCLLEKER